LFIIRDGKWAGWLKENKEIHQSIHHNPQQKYNRLDIRLFYPENKSWHQQC